MTILYTLQREPLPYTLYDSPRFRIPTLGDIKFIILVERFLVFTNMNSVFLEKGNEFLDFCFVTTSRINKIIRILLPWLFYLTSYYN